MDKCKWLDISDNKIETRCPRKLTLEEIDSIVTNYLPNVKCINSKISENNNNEIKKHLVEMLGEIEIVPTVEAFEELGNYINLLFKRSQITPGEPVGIKTGPAIIAPAMQATMKSFQVAGSGTNTVGALEIIISLLQATIPPNPLFHVFFSDEKSATEIIDLSNTIVYTGFKDVVKNYDFLDEDEDEFDKKYYEEELKKYHTKFIRINLDVYILYKKGITMNQIFNLFDSDVLIIPQSFSLGIIDIYVNKNSDIGFDNIDENFKIDMLLNNIYESTLYKKLCGIEDIIDFNISETPVLSIIKNENIDKDGNWIIYLNKFLINNREVNKQDLIKLFDVLDVKTTSLDEYIIKIDKIYSEISLKNILEKNKNVNNLFYQSIIEEEIYKNFDNYTEWKIYIDTTIKNPKDFSNFLLNINIDLIEDGIDYIIVKILKRNIRPSEYVQNYINNETIRLKNDVIETDIYKYKSKYSVLYFRNKNANLKDSTQFEELLDLEYVDNTKTYSNYIAEMIKIFGVEAGRKIFFKILSNFIYSTGSNLNPSYISFIVDFSMFAGKYYGANIKHMQRTSLGYISGLAVQAISSSIMLSSFGSRESMSNMSLSNIYGQKMTGIGTSLGYGKFDITKKDVDIEKQNLEKQTLELKKINEMEEFNRNFEDEDEEIDFYDLDL